MLNSFSLRVDPILKIHNRPGMQIESQKKLFPFDTLRIFYDFVIC